MQSNNTEIKNIKFEAWANKAKLLGVYERDFEVRIKTTYRVDDKNKLHEVNYYELVKYKGKSRYLDLPPFDFICDSAFGGNKYIEEVSINNKIDLGIAVFKHCKNLQKVNITAKIDEIPSRTFESCDKLEEIKLPNSIKTIGVGCFNGCIRLKHIELGDNVEYISYGAFMSTGLTHIRFGENIKNIGHSVVSYCKELKELILLNDNYKKGMLFDKSIERLEVVYCKELHEKSIKRQLRECGLAHVKVEVIK